ncbi:MAG: CAP domain-containing protein [Armatimonadota bacterium]|nr:CAP domain-containing protein [Armatimonadota bacterium]
MRKTLRLSITAVCLSILAFTCAPTFAESNEERVLDLVNVERLKAGVPPLTMNERLTESARRYALYLGQAGFFSHVGPDGSTLITRNLGAKYRDAIWLGENLAGGFSTPESAVAAWMNSLPHRSNILDPNFAEIGIADVVVGGSPYGHYWVQEFGMRRGALAKNPNEKALRRAGSAPALPRPERNGIVSAGGLLGEPQTSSSSDSSETPVITEINPSSTPRGGEVIVRGRGFGSSGTLRFGGLVAGVESWTDTSIVSRVPNGAISAGVTVTNDSGAISRGVGFRVTPSGPSPSSEGALQPQP